jgi:hypothetical protein
MTTTDTLTQRGYSDESLRAKITAQKRTPKVENFVMLTASRVRDGIDSCLRSAHIYHAIDQVLGRNLKQLNFTLAESFLSKGMVAGSIGANSEAIMSGIVKDLALDSMFCQVMGKDGRPIMRGGKPVFGLNHGTFHEIFVPFTLGYVQQRWAAMWNTIDQDPLYDYRPAIATPKNKIRQGVLNAWINRTAGKFGYRSDERQALLQMMKYGMAMAFPREPWFREYAIGTEGKKQLVRDGIRFDLPHRSQFFYDQSERASTINTDTGCKFTGYFQARRWGDIVADKSLWIDEAEREYVIDGDGLRLFTSSSWINYSALYPSIAGAGRLGDVSEAGTDAAALRYSSNMVDRSCVVSYSFHKIIPSEYDLYDYDEPLWHKVTSLFSEIPIKVEPFLYSPNCAYLYQRDDDREIGSSLAIEVLPFEDKITNLLRQYLLAIRRNLVNFVFYNIDGLDQPQIDMIQLGFRPHDLAEVNLVPISLNKLTQMGVDPRSILNPISFPQQMTGDLIAGIKSVIEITDRIIGLTASEVGAVTRHEITATQDTTLKDGASEKRRFILGFHEDGQNAKKAMLYRAHMEYGQDEVVVEISSDQLGIKPDEAAVAAEAVGFNIDDTWDGGGSHGVSGSKTALDAFDFTSRRDGVNRASDVQVARQMLQMFQSIFSNAAIAQAAGIDTVIEWFNTIAIYAGLPTNMRLKLSGGAAGPQGPEQMLQAMLPVVQKMVAEMGQAQLQQIGQAVQGPLAQMRQDIEQAVATIAARLSRVEGASGIAPNQPPAA